MSGPAGSIEGVSLWVSLDDPPGPPTTRLQITACPGCAALVPADRVDVHVRWHRQRDTTEGTR
ncbi:MAG: hypothetical protein L0I76_05755 [Pseudonocardia sp.]|nr:hypothetical protein [Pseudonocardia sp.]